MKTTGAPRIPWRCRNGRRRAQILTIIVAGGLLAAAGCRAPRRFPAAPLVEKQTEAGLIRAYDTCADGHADYFTIRGPDGRIRRIAYDTSGDAAADTAVDLDAIDPADRQHIVIILDGVPYHMARAYWEEGGLRLFHPPSRLIAPFPTMTDLALADVFESAQCLGFEALYFDHQANRLAGGDSNYLALKNEAWTRDLTYRAGSLLDALGYLYPQWAFRKELDDFKRLFDQRNRRDMVAYFVSTAGVGSREGQHGLDNVLRTIDRLTEELVWRTRGRAKVTLLADHGHTLTRCERIDFRNFLRSRGWRITGSLRGPRDVVPVEYGLLTYASFATRDRKALAAALLEHEGAEFATFEDGDRIVVESTDGKAFIEQRGNRYRYTTLAGDPLQLSPILECLKNDGAVDDDGFVADRALFSATLTHRYPDPLDRLWRAFHDVCEHVPDVIVNLHAGHCAGAASKMAWLPHMASTHGDLGRDSGTTFIMSTVGPLPPALRTREVRNVIGQLTGRPWPPPHEGTGE